MRVSLDLLRDLAVSFLILAFSNAFIPVLFGSEESSGKVQLIWLFCYLIIIVLLFIGRVNLSRYKNHIGILFAFCFVSILWSTFPSLTLRRAVTLLASSMLAVILYEQFSFERVAKIYVRCILMCVIISLMLYVVKRDWVVMGEPYVGVFKGVFNHKNWFSRLMVIASVFSIYLYHTGKNSITYLFLPFFFLLVILFTESSGSLMLLLFVFFLYWTIIVYRKVKQKGFVKLFYIASFLIFGFIVYSYVDVLLGLIGKDTTFTGRTVLWVLVLESIFKKPLLGYGYQAFWTGESGPSLYLYLSSESDWLAPHAHNGYLDMWLDLGIFSVVIIIIGIVVNLYRQFKTFFITYQYRDFAIMQVFVVLIGVNFFESLFLKPNNIFWVFYFYCIIYISEQIRARKIE